MIISQKLIVRETYVENYAYYDYNRLRYLKLGDPNLLRKRKIRGFRDMKRAIKG